jgi:hypothetical protein
MSHPMGKRAAYAALALAGGAIFAQQTAPGQARVVVPPPAAQGVATSQVDSLNRALLQAHPFQIEGLTVSIRSYHEFGVGDFFTVRAENPSKAVLVFELGNLLVVDAKGCQRTMVPWQMFRRSMLFNQPPPSRILPGAFVNETYIFNLGENLAFPAKIYYGDKLLTEITN